ncbi:MAG: hypothetical protein ABIA63_07230, partial [bacterium]
IYLKINNKYDEILNGFICSRIRWSGEDTKEIAWKVEPGQTNILECGINSRGYDNFNLFNLPAAIVKVKIGTEYLPVVVKANPVPELYESFRGKIKLDGKFKEKHWKNCKWHDFSKAIYSPEITQNTKVAFVHDDSSFYVGFKCMEEDTKGLKTDLDKDFWDKDYLEVYIFISSAYQLKQAYNPFNQIQTRVGKTLSKMDASPSIIKINILKDRWEGEIKIPLNQMGYLPENGELIKVFAGRARPSRNGSPKESCTLCGEFNRQETFGAVVLR